MQKSYSKRLVAYIDILGFKEVIDATVYPSGGDNKRMINYLLLTYKRFKRVFKPEYYTSARKYPYKYFWIKKNTKIVTNFSDSIVISFAMKEISMLPDVLLEIHNMIEILLWRGLVCRGAITIGKILHTPTVVFGPALVDAYLLESKHAKFPRVIIDEPVMKIIKGDKIPYNGHMRLYELENYIAQDIDGRNYLDYFRIHMDEPPILNRSSWRYYDLLYNIITNGLRLSKVTESENLRQKYMWMKEKYNSSAAFYRSKDFFNRYYRDNEDFRSYNMEYKKVKLIK
ncbi:MAG: hypothetical protein WDN26_03670 [Chitinophagaceae bacterium]